MIGLSFRPTGMGGFTGGGGRGRQAEIFVLINDSFKHVKENN